MNWLEIAGTAIGLVYLWLEYRASIWLWAASIAMPAIYLAVYYQAGLYADFAINIYYLGASIYGLVVWLTHRHKVQPDGSMPVLRTPRRAIVPLCLAAAVLWTGIALALIEFTNSTVPWSDAFTTALSIVAMYMLAKRYAEQWLAWIAVDVVCCALYFYKNLPFTATLYGFYAVIAIAGYRKWLLKAGK